MSREEEIQKALEQVNKIKPFFWRAPYPDKIPAPITMEMVEAVENKLNLKLPAAYISLLTLQNGGKPRYNHFGDLAKDGFQLNELLGIGPATTTWVGIEESALLIKDWNRGRQPDMSPTSVVLDGDGQAWVSLDYSRCGPAGEPAVIYVDNEVKIEAKRIRKAAPDFITFLEELYDGAVETTYGFIEVADQLPELIKALQSVLLVKFRQSQLTDREKPEYQAVHHKWKGWSPDSEAFPTLWLECNKHPLGEPDVFQTNLEFPQHPQCDWFLRCDIHKDHRYDLEEKLKQTPFRFVPLHIPPWEKLGW